ncbi:hypothetical protein ACQK5W_09255 [Pantoea sp. FN060301]|uniref:hypothetical protein n=1 Tax=Pantoea sp. FN060301 TaxID=3420380 RepID=UPI003D1684C3
MARLRLYSLLNKWSQIRFSLIKVVPVPSGPPEEPVMELYLCDGREPAAWLFICRLNNVSDRQATVARYMRWLEAYYQPQSEKDNGLFTRQDEPALSTSTSFAQSSPEPNSAVIAGWQKRPERRNSSRTTQSPGRFQL